MPEIIAPLKPEYGLQIPDNPVTLIGWVIWLMILIVLVMQVRPRKPVVDRHALFWLALVSVLVLILTPFFGIHVDLGYQVGFKADPINHMMFFVAVPWLVAGGILGVLPAALIAGLSGLWLAYLDKLTIYTPLIFMTIAIIFSWGVRQRYRRMSFRLLRFPLFTGLFSLLSVLPLVFLAMVLSTPGEMAERLADAMIRFPRVVLSLGGMIVIGGLVCVLIKAFTPKKWGDQAPLIPAPGENSMKYRWVTVVLPIMLVLWVALVAISYSIAENAARRRQVNSMIQTSGIVVEGLHLFLNTGQALIQDLAGDARYISGSPELVEAGLAQSGQRFSFFERIVVLELSGEWIASYPSGSPNDLTLLPNEQVAIEQARVQDADWVVPVASSPGGLMAQFGFIASLEDESGQPIRIVWGRADIETNPYAQTFLRVLEDIEYRGGISQIVGDDGIILYHTNPERVLQPYPGMLYSTPAFFEGTTDDGSSFMYYYQPISEIDWAVIVSLPEHFFRVLAWEQTLPILLISFLGISVVMIVSWGLLFPILENIDWMQNTVDKLAEGDFRIERPNRRAGRDLGQLSDAFKNMVVQLHAQWRKQNELLSVSERLSAGLRLDDSLDVIMSAALNRGVSSVRIIMLDRQEKTVDKRLGSGKHARMFEPLDDAIVAQTRSQGALILPDFTMGKLLPMQKGIPIPASMIAVPLKWKDVLLGVVWVTYQEDRSPNAETVHFIKDLSRKTSLAIVNTRALEDSIVVQQQLASALDVLKEGVLISDKDGAIVYHNKAVETLFTGWDEPIIGKQIFPLFETQFGVKFPEFTQQTEQAKHACDVHISDGKVLEVRVCPVQINNEKQVQVMVFKDITNQKEKEAQKSEFVTTVSHELLSPLTLVHGYAKILQLTGNLNEQQNDYITNIINSVEEMRNLAQNLLDMRRLELDGSLEISRFSAGDIAKKVFDSMNPHAKQKNIHLALSLPEALLLVEADRTFITQALKNLVENAIKFTKMGGEVKLSISQKEDCVVFAVQDNGIGIAPLDQQRLFERFRRFSPGIEVRQNGSGLGLAIVKSIAQRHGGKVWLESKLGKGSTFFLKIPQKVQNSKKVG